MNSSDKQLQQQIAQMVCPTGSYPSRITETEALTGTIVSRFEKVAQQYPQNLAIKSHQGELTFEQLNERANGIARELLKRVQPGGRVGLLLDHGIRSITAQLGVLKAGFTRVELNVSFPVTRLSQIVKYARISCILTRSKFGELAHQVALGQDVEIIDLDSWSEEMTGLNPEVKLGPTSHSSISFSSGSTGEPKLKIKEHLAELHYIMRVSESMGLTDQDRLLFTRSTIVIPYEAMLNGACFYPADIQYDGNLEALVDWIRDERITVVRSPVSIFRAMMHIMRDTDEFPHLRLIVLQGEPVYRADVEAYRKRFSDSCVLIGTLGVSEYGDFSHYFLNKQSPIDTATVPGGYPLRGVNVRLFNENKGAEDSEGEIGITGPFIEDNVPYPERYAAHTNQDGSISTYYLTGDLGEMAADGCIYHRGRKDFQVKIRGNRVDLLAVEAALLDIEGVSHAAVIADTDDPLDVRLIAYLEGTIHDARALRENLENQIPAYMIPSRFVFLESLPRTLTGKIDKRSLPKPELASPIETDSGPGTDEFPPTEIEIQILQIWKDVLQVDKVGIHDHFLERGGDSIKAMMVLARLNRQFDIQLSLRELFDNESVSKIAEAVQALL